MIYEDVIAGHFEVELDHGGASGRDESCLHVGEWCAGERGLIVYPVEDFTDDVEGRGEVRSADAEEDAHAFADIGFERLLVYEGIHRTVEDEVLRVFVE